MRLLVCFAQVFNLNTNDGTKVHVDLHGIHEGIVSSQAVGSLPSAGVERKCWNTNAYVNSNSFRTTKGVIPMRMETIAFWSTNARMNTRAGIKM